MTKEELRGRIIEGHRKIDQLMGVVDKMPKSIKREELGGKSIRMLRSLHSLEDGFIELYPVECLFQDKKCRVSNKGCFVCGGCPAYLNSMYGQKTRYSILSIRGLKWKLM